MSDEDRFRYREAPQDLAWTVREGSAGGLAGRVGGNALHGASTRPPTADELLTTIAQLNARLELVRQSGWTVDLSLEAPEQPAQLYGLARNPRPREPQLRATLTRKV